MPETSAYLNLGLLVMFSTLSLYILSLIFRFRQTDRNVEPLKSQRDE